MEHYSQHNLKIAATEPEHVVRKAEFDLAVSELDERIVAVEKTLDERITGPAVLRTKTPVESFESSDSVESPQPSPLSETASFSDGAETQSPNVSVSNISTEMMGVNDSLESPNPSLIGETVNATDSVESPSFQGKPIMQEITNMQGEIEVVVEDRQGNVKSRQKVTNAITDAFLRYAFYDMLNGGTLSGVLRSNTRTGYNLLARTVPSTLGIYALDHAIDVKAETFLPPYVTSNLNTLDPGVTFYNVGGNTVEDSQVMIPVDQRCYFDHTKRELVVEYVKNTGMGTVKSVCVGRSHLLKTQLYSVTQTETAIPNQWLATSTNYLVENHPTNGTSLWKAASTAAQYRFNLKNRTMDTFNSSPLYSNITAAVTVGGIVVGDHLFKAIKQAASGSTYTIRLNYVQNFRTAATVATKDVSVTCQEGMSILTDSIPVMVYRQDTDVLEIFVTTSAGDHGGGGFNVQKVVVTGLDNPATMATETVDLGLLPYNISNFGTTAAIFLSGYFDGEHYYLPYTSTIDTQGKIDVIAENAFQNGIIVSKDFKTISRVFNMRSATTTPNLIVRADTGLLQCQANATNIPYIFLSQVVSGANLPEPSVKELDDVLRILYRYRVT
jgi:hypothetical protein